MEIGQCHPYGEQMQGEIANSMGAVKTAERTLFELSYVYVVGVGIVKRKSDSSSNGSNPSADGTTERWRTATTNSYTMYCNSLVSTTQPYRH